MFPNSNIQLEQVNDIAVITPHGDLERWQEIPLIRILSSLIDVNKNKIVLNLSKVEHIHYELIQRLSEVAVLFKGLNGDLRFAEANTYVKRIFQAVAIDQCARIFDSVGEALLSFEEQCISQDVLH